MAIELVDKLGGGGDKGFAEELEVPRLFVVVVGAVGVEVEFLSGA